MARPQSYFEQSVIGFFIVLFTYAAVSKLMDFDNFRVQLTQSPLLGAYAGVVSYSVVLAELLVAAMLCYCRTQSAGLAASFLLMLLFSGYILWFLMRGSALPCTCGGLLERMSWPQHLAFNLVCVVLAAVGWLTSRKKRSYDRPVDAC